MRKIRKWILPILCFAWMLVIWQFSLSTAEESASESQTVQEFINEALDRAGLACRVGAVLVRKAAHFTEFFVLGLLAAAAATSLCRAAYYGIAVSVFTAVVDECIQYFVPGRAMLVSDMLLDSAGGLCGVLLWALAGCLAVHIRAKRQKRTRECK